MSYAPLAIRTSPNEKKTPERYYMSGAESDSEDFDDDIAKSIKTSEMANRLFAETSTERPYIELVVKFKNPYSHTRPLIVSRLRAIEYTYDKVNKTVETLFQASDTSPVYFSFNHESRYSKTCVELMEKPDSEKKTRLEEYITYLPTKNDSEYTICSENVRFRAQLRKLTPEEEKTLIGPRRKLFDEKPEIIQPFLKEGSVQIGSIVALTKAKATIKLDEET